MARQIRIEYPGAFYHVFSRGNQKQTTFLTDEDRNFFLKCLRTSHDKFGAIIHTYCLMPNHYHLFIETRSANLSRIMHGLNTAYSIYFNTKHERCGHLFQGRYKAVLVQADVYAREISRYIHLNPVRTRLVPLPELYDWSSYREYLGVRKPSSWINTKFTLSLFGEPPSDVHKYVRFVQAGIQIEPPVSLRESSLTGVLGDNSFIEKIKAEFLKDQTMYTDRELPQLRKLTTPPDPARIMALAERHLGAHNRRVKSVAIFLSHNHTSLTFGEIASIFGMSISGISNACRRIRADLKNNKSLAWAIKEIEREACDQKKLEGQTYLLSESDKR